MTYRIVALAAATALLVGCGGDALKEIQRVRAGEIDVVLLSEDGVLSGGRDTWVLEFRRAGELVDVGDVKAAATMPMAGMAPMIGDLTIERADQAGRHTVSSNLSMVGAWRLSLEWNGPAGAGTAVVSTTAQ